MASSAIYGVGTGSILYGTLLRLKTGDGKDFFMDMNQSEQPFREPTEHSLGNCRACKDKVSVQSV